MIFATPNRGTGGAGTTGILQGLIAGQQSRESEQKMEWLQKNQDRQDDVYDKQEGFGHIGNIDDMIRTGKFDQKGIDSANSYFENSKNFKGTNFSLADMSYAKDENGFYTPEFVNEYQGITGKEIVPGSTKASNGMNTYLRKNMVRMNGELFDPDTFTAGSSSYKKYKEKQAMERKLQESVIAKNLGIKMGGAGDTKYDKTKAMADKKRIEKVPIDKRTKEQNIELSVADQTLGMTKNEAVDDLVSPEFKTMFSGINKGDFSQTSNISPEAVSRAEKAQLQGGKPYDKYDETSKELNTMNMLYDLSDKFKNIDSKDYDSGIVNKMIRDYAVMEDGKGWENVKKEDREKMLNTIMKSSEVGMATAQILKDISGAAVSDEEFERVMKILTGGSVDLNNPAAVASALRGAGETMSNRSKTSIQGIRELYSPGDKIKLAKLHQQYDRPFGGHQQKPGGELSSKDAAINVVDKEAETAKDLGVDLISKAFGLDEPVELDAEGKPKPQFLKNPIDWVSDKAGWNGNKDKPEYVNKSKYKSMPLKELQAIDLKGLSKEEIKDITTEIVRAKFRGEK